MRRFDDQIGRWCNQRQITYTHYCDDMTFSSDRPLYGVYQKAKKMLAYARAYFRDDGLGRNTICIAVGYAKKMNELQGSDLGLQDRIQIYNASYSHYQPCHATAEIFSSKL